MLAGRMGGPAVVLMGLQLVSYFVVLAAVCRQLHKLRQRGSAIHQGGQSSVGAEHTCDALGVCIRVSKTSGFSQAPREAGNRRCRFACALGRE